jgi:hypothetical protein
MENHFFNGGTLFAIHWWVEGDFGNEIGFNRLGKSHFSCF